MRNARMVLTAAAVVAAFCLTRPGFGDAQAGGGGGMGLGGQTITGHRGGGGSTTGNEGDSKEKLKSILENLVADPQLSKLCTALDTAELTTLLKGSGPFTLLAPSNLAFLDLDPEECTMLLKDKTKLKATLSRHIVTSKMLEADIVKAGHFLSTAGTQIEVKTEADGKITLDGAKITTADVKCSNGVIHVIDKVYMNAKKAAAPAKPAAPAPAPNAGGDKPADGK